MATKKKKIEEIEDQEADDVINNLVSEENLELYDEYFSAGLDATGLTYPKNHYDFILFNARDYQKYYYGTAGAHALDALKEDGYFILNTNGTALNIDEVIHVLEFIGLTHIKNQSKNGFYVFQKVVK